MMRIYTRTGDKGTTAINGGWRVPKDDPRIEANGSIDELNAVIGIVRSLLDAGHEWQQPLHEVQNRLMQIMSQVATPSELRAERQEPLPAEWVTECEQQMDALMAQLTENNYFILPGGTPVSAQLQFARTMARRAERRLWTLHRLDPLPDVLLQYFNRLSDLFFVMARYEMQQQNWSEEKWRTFAFRK